jgi:hypothetical protein
MNEAALRFSLLFRRIALRTIAPIIKGPVQKRLKPKVKNAVNIEIISKGRYIKRLQISKMTPVATSPAINQPTPNIPKNIESSSSTISGVLFVVLYT